MKAMEPLSDPVTRRLRSDDLEAAVGLSVGAGWNQTADDWRVCFVWLPTVASPPKLTSASLAARLASITAATGGSP